MVTTMWLSPTLTLYFHNLVGVLDHLVFGFIPEGVSPGLNQVQNLVSHIWLGLLLKQKEGQVLLLLSTRQVTLAFSPSPSHYQKNKNKTEEQNKGSVTRL